MPWTKPAGSSARYGLNRRLTWRYREVQHAGRRGGREPTGQDVVEHDDPVLRSDAQGDKVTGRSWGDTFTDRRRWRIESLDRMNSRLYRTALGRGGSQRPARYGRVVQGGGDGGVGATHSIGGTGQHHRQRPAGAGRRCSSPKRRRSPTHAHVLVDLGGWGLSVDVSGPAVTVDAAAQLAAAAVSH